MARPKKPKSLYRQPRAPQLGEWLRQLRQERELALREVAAAAEMDQAHLSKVELGQRIPTSEQVSKLARFFKIAPGEMEARRIATKVMQEIAASPAAEQALSILREEPLDYHVRK
jgi:transcriptional regulator with XRE-family HTH domain